MRLRGLALAPTLVLFALSGCTTSSPTPPKKGQPPAAVVVASADACASPLRGSRYSLCGHVTSAEQGASGARYAITGSPDATQKPLVGTYTLSTGGFYAASH